MRNFREGMMKFDLKIVIKGVLIALCIFIVILLAARLIDRIFFRPESVFARTVKGFEEQKDQIQILFMGQSDMKYAIIPKVMPYKSYNFAEVAENYIGTYLKLKYYMDEMPRLKVVVLGLPLPSFSSSARSNWIERRHSSNYFSYGYITHQDFKELYKMKGFIMVRQKISSFSPLLDIGQFKTFWRNVRKWIRNQPIQKTIVEDGYIRFPGSAVMEGLAERRVNVHFQENNKNDFDKDLLSFFERILVLCHQRGVKVVTLMIPMTDYYLKHAEKHMTKAALYEKVLTNPQYSPYIYKHLDYLDLYAKDHPLFINEDHLNHEGATVFSERIASELSKIMEQIQKTS
jgi:Uri superfamily endonuclease